MVSILDMGGEGFNKRLEVGIDEGRDAFGRGTIGRDDDFDQLLWVYETYITQQYDTMNFSQKFPETKQPLWPLT